uniref:Uncharacterized protein n=1 Tax=Globisporangium ultimum (strain ATCC 200006 / CBS 805.95 / DAOM BR144) TaxID=431595 RepID=K3WK82_GLOUD
MAGKHTLSRMDEQVLVLYHSSLKRSWAAQNAQNELASAPVRQYGYEANYAATQIQRIVRGVAARTQLESFSSPKNQRAARYMQYVFRWLLVRQRVFRRLQRKKHAKAVHIQAWYRGCKYRDALRDHQARMLAHGVILLQRCFRGHRFWRVVTALLHDRRDKAAIVIQRCVRGWRGRQLAKAIRFEQQRHVRHLVVIMNTHQKSPRCERCTLEECTEDSLFDCFMARYIGLHDLKGARTLCIEGLTLFPSSARFCFFYAALLQVIGEDVGVAMAFLNKARHVLHLSDDELAMYEKQYLLPALQLRPNDIAVYLDLAVFCQSSEHTSRAEAHYAKCLSLLPVDYRVPGYLHRVQTLDRLLLNYHRFCSIFNSRQTNILAKIVPVAKRGEKIRFMVAKLNQFVVITPADQENVCRVNTIYLSEGEVLAFLSERGEPVAVEKPGMNELLQDTEAVSTLNNSNGSVRSLVVWRKNSQKSSMSLKNSQNLTSMPKETAVPVGQQTEARTKESKANNVIIQLHQDTFQGLHIRPEKLSVASEKRSKVNLNKEHAEMLLKEVVFIDSTKATAGDRNALKAGASIEPSWGISTAVPAASSSSPNSLHYVVILPFLLKRRQQRASAVLISYAAIDLQRVFRGFRFRSQMRRERLIQSIQQRQVDNMLAQLQANFLFRERRRLSAIAIQRIYKGFAHRNRLRRWHLEATQIQRVFRGYRGRKRALAFRDGNCTFYMAEKVFHRGIEVSGRRIMLAIEKCGLSFRFDGYDLENCTTYPGFFSHESTLGLLCHLNWAYAESFCGRECNFHGKKLVIEKVVLINRTSGECFMSCAALSDDESGKRKNGRANPCTVPLVDCIQSINIRSVSTLGKDATVAAMPLTVDDTPRLVQAMTERLALVHTIPMATQELKKKIPANFLLTVTPPLRRHLLFKNQGTLDQVRISNVVKRKAKTSKRSTIDINLQTPEELVFPITDGMRGVTIGHNHFRKKCSTQDVGVCSR